MKRSLGAVHGAITRLSSHPTDTRKNALRILKFRKAVRTITVIRTHNHTMIINQDKKCDDSAQEDLIRCSTNEVGTRQGT